MVVCGPALAQINNVVPGYMSPAGQNGCPAASRCFVAYGATGPSGGSVSPVPTTSGGLSVFSAIVPNNTTSFVIKASPGQLYGLEGFSIAATTPVWLKTYDAAQGSTTCGSGTPKARYLIPASGGAPGSGLIPSSALGDAYGTAITGCITAGIADNDTTAPAASSYTLNVHYK